MNTQIHQNAGDESIQIGNAGTVIIGKTSEFHARSALPLPPLIIGRTDDQRKLKARLGISATDLPATPMQTLTIIRGWPGVGKTTMVSILAHDPEIDTAFPDGVLSASLGPAPNILSELMTWGRDLHADDVLDAQSIEKASARLAGWVKDKRMLLIIDDLWETEHFAPFRIGGRNCAMLVTTRITSVAQAIAPTPSDIYNLLKLTDENALELFRALAPAIVAEYPDQSIELLHSLEGLPLGIQVAGHLLNVEASYGFGVEDLLAELREGKKLLEAQAPADRIDIAKQTIPTVAVLLQQSTNRLPSEIRDYFAYLGAFAPKPATFDLAALQSVWMVEDPKPIVRNLVDRGLLEPVGGRFQMHALLVSHARSLLQKE